MGTSLNYAGTVERLFNDIKGLTVRYATWPALVGDGAVGSGGVLVASGHAAWSAYVALVAALGIATDYWICNILVHSAAALGVYDIELTDVGPVVLAEGKVDLTAVTTNIGPITLPYPVFMAGGALVNARAGNGTGAIKNIYIGITYATLL